MTLSEQEWNDLGEYRNDLEHYGVPGMKWGVRKDREWTGTRRTATPQQKKKARQRMSSLEERRKRQVAKRSEAIAKKAEKQKLQAIKKRDSILRNPTKLYKHRYEFTQDEINAALRRFDWEKRLNEYSVAQLERGRKYLDVTFNTVNSGINLYNAAARIANTFSGTNLPYVPQAKIDKKKD